MSQWRRGTAATVALLATCATAGRAQRPVSSGALVVRLGRDTIAVERFTRWADRMEGVLVRRMPVTMTHHYVVSLGRDGRPLRFEDSIHQVSGPRPPNGVRAVTAAFAGDSATVEVIRDTVATRRVSAPEGFPTLPESYALYELWLSSLRVRGIDSGVVFLVAPAGGPAGRLAVRLAGTDSARCWILGSPARMHTDGSGRLLGLDGTATTLKYEVTRVEDLDVAALAADFARRDAQGNALGWFISKRDTVVATIGGVRLWVDYGRPAVRGRAVFKHGVLGDTLWRTGANAATQLEVDRDVEIGGHRLAAGRYSLWTRVTPDNSSYQLVVNSQNGQWGTQHDVARDLFSVPLQARHRDTTAEVFTISVTGTASGGVLSFSWANLDLVAPISVP